MDSTGQTEIKDFSLPISERPFKIEADVYRALPSIPLQLMASVAKFRNFDATTSDDGLEKMLSIFDEFLFPESSALFRKRVTERVITIGHLNPLMDWLMEGYGMRPTVPSSDSSNPSTVQDGMSSTDGVSLEESTSSDSQERVLST